MEEKILKERLTAIKAKKIKPDERERRVLAFEMLEKIGVIDYELRDDLIYSVFSKWIIDGVFSAKDLKEFLRISMDNDHMFYKIGEDGTDSVFTRTFSALIAAAVLYRNNRSEFLSKEETDLANGKVVRYMKEEKDLRGYVDGKGWAHSAAHTADALDELAQCPKTDEANLKKILDAIRFKVMTRRYTYVNEEDERMVTAVVSALDRNILSYGEFGMWLKGFEKLGLTSRWEENHRIIINVKSFLRSLYFRTLDTDNFRYLEENNFLDVLKAVGKR